LYDGTTTLYSADYYPIDPVTSEQLGPDALGRITAVEETVEADSVLREYTYDLAGRLDGVYEGGVEVASFAYDANGNRLTYDTLIAGETCTATYDLQDRLLSCSAAGHPDVVFNWDENGSLESKTDAAGTTLYDYDVFGNLRFVELPDGTFVEYAIDPAGRRIGRIHYDTDGTTVLDERRWLYGDALNPVAELDGTGAVTAVFVYGSRGHVPDYMIAGGETYRIISDVRGSVRLVVNTSTGAVVQRIDYDAWGRVTNLVGDPLFQPFGFAGGLRDPETGLTRFGARDYDPLTGRWTSRDPLLFGGLHQVNVYLYVGAEPINYVDPDGEFQIIQPVIGTASAGATAAVGWDTILSLALAVLFSPDHDTRNVLAEKVIFRRFSEAITSDPTCSVNDPYRGFDPNLDPALQSEWHDLRQTANQAFDAVERSMRLGNRNLDKLVDEWTAAQDALEEFELVTGYAGQSQE
jgi:RHS repeat-associated protein